MATSTTPRDILSDLAKLPEHERIAIAHLIAERATLWRTDAPHGPGGWLLCSLTITKRQDGAFELTEGYALPRALERHDPEHRTVLHEPGKEP